MNVPTKACLSASIILALVLFASGCDSRASRAEAAYNKYQAAMATGDIYSARASLQALVAADEDVPAYWVELGKLQYQLRDFNQAYFAFTRAYELKRADPEILRYLTQIALQSGALDQADEHSKELDLVAPGDPIVKITAGLIALQRNDFEGANKQADTILATVPNEPNARVLKARALVGLNRSPEAIALLEDQVAQLPNDPMSLKALLNLQRRSGAWPAVVALGRRYRAVAPNDFDVGLMTVEAAFRSNDLATARTISTELLKPDIPPERLVPLFELWRTYWKGPESIALAERLAAAAGPRQQASYADYLVDVGAAAAAVRVVGARARQPAAPDTLDARAIYFAALAKLGKTAEARQGLEAVLARDPENNFALAALAPLLVKLGDKNAALNVARKLVTVEPTGIDARLTLVHVYEAVGDRGTALRTLWDGFHEIPGAERIYTPLRAYLSVDSESTQRLDREYAEQRQRKIVQEAV